MKKICIFILITVLCCPILSGCSKSTHVKQSMIHSQRRFANYMDSKVARKNVVDLSEGPRLRYDATFGPINPNFDIKIVDPY